MQRTEPSIDTNDSDGSNRRVGKGQCMPTARTGRPTKTTRTKYARARSSNRMPPSQALQRRPSRATISGAHRAEERHAESSSRDLSRSSLSAASHWCELTLLTSAATAAATASTPTWRPRGAATATFAAEPATTTPTAAAASATTAASGRTPLTSDVYGDGPPVQGRAVQRLDGALGLFRRPVLDKAEASGLPRCSVDDDASRGDLTELGEGFLQLLVHRRVCQIAHIQPVSHYYSISIAWHRIRSDSKVISAP